MLSSEDTIFVMIDILDSVLTSAEMTQMLLKNS